MRFVKNLIASGLTLALIGVTANAQPTTDAQGDVGIGTFAPHASSKLDLTSTSKGFLVPRMTTAQRDAIVSPAHSLLIFNTTNDQFEYYDATIPGWTSFPSASGPFWRLDGNTITGAWNGATGRYLGTNNANDLAIVTRLNQNIDIWTNNTQRAIVTGSGDVGIGQLSPSARLDVVGDGVNPAIEATNTGGVIAVDATVDGGSGLVLGSVPAVGGDNDDETGVAGTSGSGVGVFGASSSNHGVNGLSLSGGVAGVFGRNDQAGGYGVHGTSVGGGTGGRFDAQSGADAVEVNQTGAGLGIDLNGGALDGDDQGNALGDGSANQQLTVRGTQNAVVGQTLGGSPSVWDLVVQGDVVATGIYKSGGSLWVDGVSATHTVSANAPFDVETQGPNDLTLSTNTTNAVVIDGATQNVNILNNIDVDGSANVDGPTTLNNTLDVDGATTLNSTLDVDGATTLNSSLDVDGHTELNATLNVDGASTFQNTITQLGGGQVSFSGNVDANNGLDVSGADLTVDASVSIDAPGSGHDLGTSGTDAQVLLVEGDPNNVGNYELIVDGDAQVTGLLSLPGLTPGSVTFVGPGGTITEDNPNFFWDDGSNELGIGTSAPSAHLDINNPGGIDNAVRVSQGTIGDAITVTHSSIGDGVASTHNGIGNAFVALVSGGIGDGFNATISTTSIGDGVNVTQNGSGDGIFVDDNSSGHGIQVDETSIGDGILVTEAGSGNGLTVNADATGIGIDLNGAHLDGDDQGNLLGDGSANQQLTVRGTQDAVVGNTLGGNPSVWDLVVQGDAVATGIIKSGGSLWIDGVSATHNIHANAPLQMTTSGGGNNITINSSGGTTTVDDDLVVTGTSNLQNSIFNTTGTNGGAVQIADPLWVTGTSNLNGTIFNSAGAVTINDALTQIGGSQVIFSGNVDANNGLDVTGTTFVTGHIVPTADATYDLGTNANRFRDIYVDGASVHVGNAIGQEMELGYAGNEGTINVDGAAGPQVEIDAGGSIIRFDPDGDGTLTAFVRNDGIGVNTGGGADARYMQDGLLRTGGATETYTMSNTGGDLDVNVQGDLDVDNNLNVDGTSTLVGSVDAQAAGNVIGNGADAEQLQIDGVDGGAVEVDVNGDMDISGTLTVGSFTLPPLSSDLDLNGNDIVDNTDNLVTVNDGFNVTGLTDLDGTLNVDGAATMQSTLTVMGNTILDANTTVNGNAEFNGTAQFDGASTFNAASTWTSGNNVTLNNGTITANKTAAGSAISVNASNATTAIALNVAAGGGRTVLSYGTGAGLIPQDVSVWNATGNVTLPGTTENGQVLWVVNSSGGAITVTSVTGGTAAGFNNNDVRGYVYAGGWFELP